MITRAAIRQAHATLETLDKLDEDIRVLSDPEVRLEVLLRHQTGFNYLSDIRRVDLLATLNRRRADLIAELVSLGVSDNDAASPRWIAPRPLAEDPTTAGPAAGSRRAE